MHSPSTPFDFQTLFDCRVTTTVLVSALVLSILHLQDRDMSALIADWSTWKGEPWRLVTTTLLHVNFIHLAFNLYWTARFGVAVETAFGAPATAGIMLLLAVTSSAPQLMLAGPGIGLSGIVYGLFGFLWVLGRFDARYRGCLHPQTTMLFVAWFFFCILLDVTGTMPIGNVAHGAGAIVGAATGWAVADSSRGVAVRALPLFTALTAVVLACTVLQRPIAQPYLLVAQTVAEASAALQAGDHARAERLFTEAAAEQPDEWMHWWMLGTVRWVMGHHERALIAFEQAAKLHELEPELARILDEARARQRDPGSGSGTSK